MTIRDQHKAQGLCLYCGQPNDRLPKGICMACAARHSALVTDGQRAHHQQPPPPASPRHRVDGTPRATPHERLIPRRIDSWLDGELLCLEFTTEPASSTPVVVGFSRAMVHVLVQVLAAAVERQGERAIRPVAASLRVV